MRKNLLYGICIAIFVFGIVMLSLALYELFDMYNIGADGS